MCHENLSRENQTSENGYLDILFHYIGNSIPFMSSTVTSYPDINIQINAAISLRCLKMGLCLLHHWQRLLARREGIDGRP